MTNIHSFPGKRGGRQTTGDWTDNLLLNEKGQPKANLANALIALRCCEYWTGRLALDSFTNRIMLVGAPPWEMPVALDDYKPREWRGVDDARVAEWLQVQGINVGVPCAATAVEVVADENRYDPLREYLADLVWDGVPRLDHWLINYLGVEPSVYAMAVGKRWMVSAVARLAEPGCKADHVLILEGRQDLGKSSALAVLGGPWFTDQISDFESKDASVDLQGAWIVELGELDAVNRSEVSRIKQFLTRRVDRFRPPYGRRVEAFPRRCVFAGTHNPVGPWNKDPTGGRRFWPVTVTKVDLKGLERDRDQLWAEAVHLYNAEFNWWLEHDLDIRDAQEQQRARQVLDIWHDPIADWLALNASRDRVTIAEILTSVINLEVSRQGQREMNRVAEVLTTLGWERRQFRDRNRGGKLRHAYFRPDEPEKASPFDSTACESPSVTTPPPVTTPEGESGDTKNTNENNAVTTVTTVTPSTTTENEFCKGHGCRGGERGYTGYTVENVGKNPVTTPGRHALAPNRAPDAGDRLKGAPEGDEFAEWNEDPLP